MMSLPVLLPGHMFLLGDVSVQRGLCPGESLPRVSVQGWGLCPPRPPYGKGRPIRILLECILVPYLYPAYSVRRNILILARSKTDVVLKSR